MEELTLNEGFHDCRRLKKNLAGKMVEDKDFCNALISHLGSNLKVLIIGSRKLSTCPEQWRCLGIARQDTTHWFRFSWWL